MGVADSEAFDRTTLPSVKPLDEPAALHAEHCRWPRIEQLQLSPEECQRRRRYIGGSDANTILSGCPERITNLWREKRGVQEPEDLSGRIAMVLGSWTEAFNRQWYEKCSGHSVEQVGLSAWSALHPWRACTLDGYVTELGAVFEAKHCSGFSKAEEVLARYMPQLQHNMAVLGSECAVLSVIFGNAKWQVFEVAADWLYQEELLSAELAFWKCVESGAPPVALAPPPPPKPFGVREICLEGNNAWAAAAADWLANKEAARCHAAAVTSLKSMVEEDASRVFGHGIEVKRSKAGALSIREVKE